MTEALIALSALQLIVLFLIAYRLEFLLDTRSAARFVDLQLERLDQIESEIRRNKGTATVCDPGEIVRLLRRGSLYDTEERY